MLDLANTGGMRCHSTAEGGEELSSLLLPLPYSVAEMSETVLDP